MTRKPILCLDFDGVVHSYTSGWKGAHVVADPPTEGAIAFILGALPHFQVVIFSSRSGEPGGMFAMIGWLREHAGQAWHESPDGPGLESVVFVDTKPAAMVTLDDRALTFNGTWPTIEELKAFEPWNKRKPGNGRYRRKPEVLEAWQVNPDMGTCPKWLTDALGKTVTIISEIPAFIVRGVYGDERAECGSWIMRYPNGEMYVAGPNTFSAIYEPAP